MFNRYFWQLINCTHGRRARVQGMGGTYPPDFLKTLILTIGAHPDLYFYYQCAPQFFRFRVPSKFSYSSSAYECTVLNILVTSNQWLIRLRFYVFYSVAHFVQVSTIKGGFILRPPRGWAPIKISNQSDFDFPSKNDCTINASVQQTTPIHSHCKI